MPHLDNIINVTKTNSLFVCHAFKPAYTTHFCTHIVRGVKNEIGYLSPRSNVRVGNYQRK